MITKPYKNINLSRLGMGNMRLPIHNDRPATPIDRVKAQEIIDYAMATESTIMIQLMSITIANRRYS